MVGLPIYQDGDILFIPGSAREVCDGLQALATAHGTLRWDHMPDAAAVMKRIAEVVVQPVVDPAPYIIEMAAADPEPMGKPHIGRAPDVAPGKMAVQSLIFDREKFTPAEARAWIKDHPEFGDYDIDETQTSYRFRQYDPEHFSAFRTREFGPGLVAVLGVVKTAEGTAEDIAARIIGSELRKAADGAEEHYVLSLVLEPNDGANADAPLKPDTQGDVYSADEIRRTAHGWMERGGKIDLGHNWKALGEDQVKVVETYLAPVAFELGGYAVRKGSWLLGLRVLDDVLWGDVKDGKLGAYSVGGSAKRTPVEG